MRSRFLLSLCFACAAGAQTGPAAKPPAPSGQEKPATIQSGSVEFGYLLLKGMERQDDVAAGGLADTRNKTDGAVQKAAIACLSIPLTAVDSGDPFRLLLIMRLDGTCLGVDATRDMTSPMAANAIKQTLARFGTPSVTEPADYKLASYDAVFVSGKVESASLGKTLYGAASCIVGGKDAICWEFVASSRPALHELAAVPVTFKGTAAAPVVPDALNKTDCGATVPAAPQK